MVLDNESWHGIRSSRETSGNSGSANILETPNRHRCVLDIVRRADRNETHVFMEAHSTPVIDRDEDSHPGSAMPIELRFACVRAPVRRKQTRGPQMPLPVVQSQAISGVSDRPISSPSQRSTWTYGPLCVHVRTTHSHPGSMPSLSFTAILKCCLQPM